MVVHVFFTRFVNAGTGLLTYTTFQVVFNGTCPVFFLNRSIFPVRVSYEGVLVVSNVYTRMETVERGGYGK